MSDANFFADLPLPPDKVKALSGLPCNDQQAFREWLNGVLLQQVDSFLTVGLRQIGTALTGIPVCQPTPPEITQAFKRRWVGAGRPETGWEGMAADSGINEGLAARLVRRWLREHAQYLRENALQRLVMAGANDWQISRWLGASHAEIQRTRAEVGTLAAFKPLTDETSTFLWRHWKAAGGGKSAEVLLALHQLSGVAVQRLYAEVGEWIKVDMAIGR